MNRAGKSWYEVEVLGSSKQGRKEVLLNTLRLAVGTDEGVEDGQDMTAVIDHAGKNVAKVWVAFGLAMPFGENRAGDFNVTTQLVRGVAAEEEAVEKGRFALRKV